MSWVDNNAAFFPCVARVVHLAMVASNTNVVFNNQQCRPLQQTWMQLLPYDIVSLVLGHLNQHELLQCMAVCSSWYQDVPYCTTERWHTVKIFRHHGGLGNKRLARCLGQHVRRISISGYETQHQLNQVLNDLVNLDCVWIESLGEEEKERGRDWMVHFKS